MRFVSLTKSAHDGGWFVVHIGRDGETKDHVGQFGRDAIRSWAASIGMPEAERDEELDAMKVLSIGRAIRWYKEAIKDYLRASAFHSSDQIEVN